jgi:hypothetical protein
MPLLFRLTAEVPDAIVPRARTPRVKVGRESRWMTGAPESGEVPRRHAVASIGLAGCGGAKASATPKGRDQLRDCCLRWRYSSGSSQGQPPRRRPYTCVSHEHLLHLRRRKRGVRISGERDRLGSGATSRSSSTPTARPCGFRSTKTPSLVASREMSPMCRSRGISESSGDAWTAKVRYRHAISATAGTDRG